MKDSPVFNARFVSIIEKNPVLYDHTSEEYSDRDLQDQTWRKIANELNQTVIECKERWKNLRGSYTRHLKYQYKALGSSAKKKKAYYLAKHMAFLLPFTKTREETGNMFTSLQDTDNSDSEFNIKNEVLDSEFENPPEQIGESTFPTITYPKSSGDQDFTVCMIEETCSGSDVDDKVLKKCRLDSNKSGTTVENVDESAVEYIKRKHKASTSMTSVYQRRYDEDPDVLFLMSLVSDMKKMDDSEKRRFKIAILMTAGKILDKDNTPINV